MIDNKGQEEYQQPYYLESLHIRSPKLIDVPGCSPKPRFKEKEMVVWGRFKPKQNNSAKFVNFGINETISELVTRKNSCLISQQKNEDEMSPKRTTPFQNRKISEGNSINKKIATLQRNRQLSNTLEQSQSSWLIVKVLDSRQSKVTGQLLRQQFDRIRSGVQSMNDNPSQGVKTAEKISATVQLSEKKGKQKQTKKNKFCNVKNKKLMRQIHRLNSQVADQTIQMKQCFDLRIQNRTSVSYKSHQKDIKKKFNYFLKSTGSRQRNHSALVKPSSISQFPFTENMKIMNFSQIDSDDEKRVNISSALNWFKIDMSNRLKTRPQTALKTNYKSPSSSKSRKPNPESALIKREVTGWEDTSDRGQRQIYF